MARSGFRALAFDFRGRGQSYGGPQASSRDDVHLDVLAAVRYLHEDGAKTVSVVGGSFGGWAAAIDEPERMQGRKLFLTTRDDFSRGGVLRLPGLRAQFERAREPKELVILEGSAHAQHIFGTDQADRLMAEILRFLSEQ